MTCRGHRENPPRGPDIPPQNVVAHEGAGLGVRPLRSSSLPPIASRLPGEFLRNFGLFLSTGEGRETSYHRGFTGSQRREAGAGAQEPAGGCMDESHRPEPIMQNEPNLPGRTRRGWRETPYGVTTNGRDCAKRSQFRPGARGAPERIVQNKANLAGPLYTLNPFVERG
jgi:hypothetical protein